MKTDIDEVKRVAKAMLYLPVEPSDAFGGIFVNHPFYDSIFRHHPVTGEMINIFADAEGRKAVEKRLEEAIDGCEDTIAVMSLIRTPYYMAFLKFAKPHMARADFARAFAEAWVNEENPNQDPNLPIKTAVKWFRSADKEVLMQEDELVVYHALPERFTLYRGVAVGRNPDGLSYTRNKEIASWFAHRFDTATQKGYLRSAEVSREEVLCYFNRRDEDEYVCYPRALEKGRQDGDD